MHEEITTLADAEYGAFSDIGNALRIVDRFQHDLRYVPEHGWYRYESYKLVKLDGLPLEEGMALPDLIRSEIDGDTPEGTADSLRKWADKSSSGARIREALALASDLPPIRAKHEQLDRDAYELNTPLGVFDLFDGESRDTLAKDMLTRATRVSPAGPETAEVFHAFLERVLPSVDVRNFVQRAIGYSLTGLTKEEVFFILHGNGQNGKSKLLSAINHALGNYSHTFDPKLLLMQRYEGHPTNIASLFKVRFAYTSEIGEGALLDEAKVKSLTGGDEMTARFMRKDQFSWTPTHKLWLATNHLPVIKGQDKGMWRRVLVVPFEVDIPDDERDNDLESKLHAEAPGILAWCINGAVEYLKHGLNPPAEVLMASAHYKQEQDTTALFLAECTVPEPGAICPSGELYLAYKRWSEDNGNQPLTSNAFGRELTRIGYEAGIAGGGKGVRKGLRLVERSWV